MDTKFQRKIKCCHIKGPVKYYKIFDISKVTSWAIPVICHEAVQIRVELFVLQPRPCEVSILNSALNYKDKVFVEFRKYNS